MKKDMELRVFSEAEFILRNKCTIREMCRFFYVSKSTIHVDLTCRLKRLNSALFRDVYEILKFNYSVKHLRGGNRTKEKYLKKKNEGIGLL